MPSVGDKLTIIDMSCNLPDNFIVKSTVVEAKKSPKRRKLEARVSDEQKELIERAAAYDGVSQSDFIVNAAMAAARKIQTSWPKRCASARAS